MKISQIDKAIENLEDQKKVLELAIQKLKEQAQAPKAKKKTVKATLTEVAKPA